MKLLIPNGGRMRVDSNCTIEAKIDESIGKPVVEITRNTVGIDIGILYGRTSKSKFKNIGEAQEYAAELRQQVEEGR